MVTSWPSTAVTPFRKEMAEAFTGKAEFLGVFQLLVKLLKTFSFPVQSDNPNTNSWGTLDLPSLGASVGFLTDNSAVFTQELFCRKGQVFTTALKKVQIHELKPYVFRNLVDEGLLILQAI